MENTNLVPELSQELIKELMPFQPIIISINSEGAYIYESKDELSRELWSEIRKYLGKKFNTRNLLHLLSYDLLDILRDYHPVKIFEHPHGYDLNGKGIGVTIYRNGDYKGEGIDNIDGRLWMHIARQLNEVCSNSKVDEFAKHITTTDLAQETIKTVDQQLTEIKAFRRLADVMGFKDVSIEDYFKIIGYINKTLKP